MVARYVLERRMLVVPISAAELALTRSNGLEALLERFERANVASVFDFLRPSVV